MNYLIAAVFGALAILITVVHVHTRMSYGSGMSHEVYARSRF